MSPVAPARLPEGFTLEPATVDHTAEVYAVVAAEMTEAFGLCPMTEDDVRADLAIPPPAVTMQCWSANAPPVRPFSGGP